MTPVSIRHVAPNCLSTHISTLTLLINDVIKEGGLVCVCVGVFVCVLGWGVGGGVLFCECVCAVHVVLSIQPH